MSRITKKMLAEQWQVGYQRGLDEGRRKGLAEAAAQPDAKRALIQLISVVGQTIQSQNGLVESLSRVLDNSGRL